MLWQKESSEANALYKDLFASEDKDFLELTFMMTKWDNTKPKVQKSFNESLAQRKEGNDLFARGEFNKAIEKYNQSLCLAPSNSEHVSLAYANRSICFLKLKMYNECLVDIELAKQSNYPDHLVYKLDERECECEKGIKNGEFNTNDIDLELSYDPHETWPCLANVLNVVRDGKGNSTVTAREDIGVGKTIAVGKAFAVYSIMNHNSKCNICLKRNTNLVPCRNCTSAMFCHGQCDGNVLHEGECGLVFSGIGDLDAGIMKEVRIILMVIDLFSNADELMDFVQQSVHQDSMDEPITLAAPKLRYRDFLNLQFSQAGQNSENFLTSLYFMYKLALEVGKVKMYFNTKKHRRFLMHLLGLHSKITDDNSTWSKRTFEVNGQVKHVCTHGVIGLHDRFFDMSCAPNIMHSDHNDQSVFITIRPVKKGEKLVTFIADYLLLESEAERQQAYREKLRSPCKCSRCQGLSATSAQQQTITSDPDYRSVSSRQDVADSVQAMNEKYVNFLNKHGHIPWCDALGKVVDAYLYFLRDRISGVGVSTDIMDAIFE